MMKLDNENGSVRISTHSSHTAVSLDSSNTLVDGYIMNTTTCIKEKHSSCLSSLGSSQSNLESIDLDVEAQSDKGIPPKFGCRLYRFLRWNFFSPYRRLFTLVFLSNVAVLIWLTMSPDVKGLTYLNLTTATSINFLFSIILRQEHVVNMLFIISSSLPLKTPLLLRRWFARVYGYGGLHSGCAVAGTMWFCIFTGLITRHLFVEPYVQLPLAIITYCIICFLSLILIFSHPTIRAKIHNSFEMTHRFAGWTVVALFWTLTILMIHYSSQLNTESFERLLVQNPTFWCLIVITICIIYPWTRLRRVDVRPEPLSNHAIRLHFEYRRVSSCMGLRLADFPLKETHAFAVIPERNHCKGFSVVVSNAGDWTNRIIQNPPTKLWVKGVPCYGVLRVATMFKPVLIVATGSGIGPCLSLFNGRPDLQCRILWSTPSPMNTYGQAIIDQVFEADPNAVIVDTRKSGRPDMVSMAYKLFKESDAEAVAIISNPKVTKKVVYGLETRGVPAYGPIFDS